MDTNNTTKVCLVAAFSAVTIAAMYLGWTAVVAVMIILIFVTMASE